MGLLNDKKSNTVEILQKINNAAHRAVKQINDLLKFAGISNYTAEIAEVDLTQCMDRIVKDFELIIAGKDLVISYDPLGSVMAIPVQIEQLLNNLIGNALKFAREDKLIITVSLRDVEPDEIKHQTTLDPQFAYVCLTVQDNGIGFEQKYADKIFTIFSRLHDNSQFVGTGIGLAICKKIVENHNGQIIAQGTAGQGAAFHVFLKK